MSPNSPPPYLGGYERKTFQTGSKERSIHVRDDGTGVGVKLGADRIVEATFSVLRRENEVDKEF